MVSLNSWQKNFDEAKQYLELAKTKSPNSNMVISAERFYLRALSANEGLKNYSD